MDNYCLDEFGTERYDENLAYNTQINNPKLDPLIGLVKEASFDYIWRDRINHFANRLEVVSNDCLRIAGEVRPDVAVIVDRLKTNEIVRLKELCE